MLQPTNSVKVFQEAFIRPNMSPSHVSSFSFSCDLVIIKGILFDFWFPFRLLVLLLLRLSLKESNDVREPLPCPARMGELKINFCQNNIFFSVPLGGVRKQAAAREGVWSTFGRTFWWSFVNDEFIWLLLFVGKGSKIVFPTFLW